MVDPRLNRIGRISAAGKQVENLACLINVNSLMDAHRRMDGRKATGIDRVSKEDYDKEAVGNLTALVKRMANRGYYSQPSRRVYIDKS